MTVILYDHATTFALEVELIWKKRFTLGQLLYLINRYVGDALFIHGTISMLSGRHGDPAFEAACKSGVHGHSQIWLSLIGLWTMQLILVIRIWCMYDRSIILLWVVGVAFVLQTLGGGLLNGLSSNWKGDAIYIPGTKWGFCVPRDVPDFLWVFWCFVAAFDSLVCALALWEGIGFVRRRRRRSAREREAENADSDLDSVVLSLQRPPNLLRVLLRDSMIAPFITFIVCPLNLLAIVTTLPPTLSALVFQVTPMVPPLLGCRMILNLRGAYYRPFDEEYYTVPIYDEGTNPCPVFIPGDLELDSITSRVHAEFSNVLGKDDRIVA